MCEKSAASVDILMATYNGEKYVGEQIESIQAQSFNNWRLLISDDCSSDDTLEIVKKYAEQDPRIIVVSQGKRYGSAKLNFMSLLTAADAPYVMFCDQDDVWLPKKIELTLAKMHELEHLSLERQPLLVFTDMKVVDKHLGIIADSFESYSNIDSSRVMFRQILAQSVGAGCTMMINRDLQEDISGYAPSNGIIMHDWWLTLVAAAFGQIGHVSVPTSLYRQHGNNAVAAKDFSLVDRITHMRRMIRNVNKTITQACCFDSIYGDVLRTDQKKTLSYYIKSYKGKNVFVRVISLIRSGCWKKGTRKIGQLIALCFSDDTRLK
ncbi:glycosyltransferase family 2 protein [Bifidobacterium moukalabense]|uniref:glycosyltransferase family 2 protein n=1 Tax=Bifidobacterium moukalabense TaxID=1333651 RepID=UPI0010F70489|nr:glycosyltransferase family 2 protein [Bifidobacterium moukalabense]